jgi:hypothetical protein
LGVHLVIIRRKPLFASANSARKNRRKPTGGGGFKEAGEGGAEGGAEEAREVQREVKQALDEMVAQLVEGDRVQRRKEQTDKRRGHNSACGVENKRRQSGRWQNNYYGHWEQWTERQ